MKVAIGFVAGLILLFGAVNSHPQIKQSEDIDKNMLLKYLVGRNRAFLQSPDDGDDMPREELDQFKGNKYLREKITAILQSPDDDDDAMGNSDEGPEVELDHYDEEKKYLDKIMALLQSSDVDIPAAESDAESDENYENMLEGEEVDAPNVQESYLQSSDEDEVNDEEDEGPEAESEPDTTVDLQKSQEEEELLYNQQSHEVAAASQNNIDSAIMQGDTVALESFVGSYWVGCAGSRCGRANCPKMLMSGSDWTRCYGEVFEIYRQKGPGQVRVGDRVGLHYPRERGKWLGCNFGKNCGKAGCPGQPTQQYGFARSNSWNSCWGEVFIVYARGKNNGEVINSDDNIALYYARENLWFAQGYNQLSIKLPCLGKTLPPPLASYDGCAFETLRIWKRDC